MKCYVLIAVVVVIISVKNSEETDSIVIIHSYNGVPKEKDFKNDKYKRKLESRKLANHHYYMHRHKPTATTKGNFWNEIENDLTSSTIQPTLLTKDISTKTSTSYSHFVMKHPARIPKGIISHPHYPPKHTFKRHSDYGHHHKHRFNREKVSRQRLKDLQANLTDSQQSVDSNDPIDVFDFGVSLPKEPLYQSENYSVPRTGPIRTRSTKNHSLEKKYSITDEIFLSAEVDKDTPVKKDKQTEKDKEKETSSHAFLLEKRRSNTTTTPSSPKRPTPAARNRFQAARRRSDSTSEIVIQRNDSWIKKAPIEEKQKNTTTHKNDEEKTTTPRTLSRRRQLKRPTINSNQKLIDDFYAKLNSELTPPKEEPVQTITPLPSFPAATTHEDNIKFSSNEGTSSVVEIVDLQPFDEKNLQQTDPNKILSSTKTAEEDHKIKIHTKPRHIRKKPTNEDSQDVFTYTYNQHQNQKSNDEKDKDNHRSRSRKRKPERKDSVEITQASTKSAAEEKEEDEIEEFSKKHVVDLHVHHKQKPPPTNDHKKTEIETETRRHKPEENHHRGGGYRIRKKKLPVYDLEEPQPTIQAKNDLADFTEQEKNSHTPGIKHELNEVESFVKNFEKELQTVRHKLSKQQQNLEKEEEVTTPPKSRLRHKTDKKTIGEDLGVKNYDYGDFKPSLQIPVEFESEKPPRDVDVDKLKESDVDYFINFFKQHQQLQKNETKSVRGRKKQNHHQRGKQLLETTDVDSSTVSTFKSTTTQTIDDNTNKRRKNARQKKPDLQLDAETRRLNLFKNLKQITQNQHFPTEDKEEGQQFGIDLFSGLNLEESKLLKALNENLQPLSSAKVNQRQQQQQDDNKNGDYQSPHNYDKESLTTNFFSVPNITFFKIDNPLIKANKINDGGDDEGTKNAHGVGHFDQLQYQVNKKLKEETDDFREVYNKLQKATKNVQKFVNGAFPNQPQSSDGFIPVAPNLNVHNGQIYQENNDGELEQNKNYKREKFQQNYNDQGETKKQYARGGNFRQRQRQQQKLESDKNGGNFEGRFQQQSDYQQQLDLLNNLQQQQRDQQNNNEQNYQQQLDLQQNYPQQISSPLNSTKPNRLNLKTTVFQNGLKTAQEVLDINLFANLPLPKQNTPIPEAINVESNEPKINQNVLNQKVPEIFSVNLYTTSQENLPAKTEPNVPSQTNPNQDYPQYGLSTNQHNNQQNYQESTIIQDPVYQIITKSPVPVKQIVKPTPTTMYTSTTPTLKHQLNQPFNNKDLQDFLNSLNEQSLKATKLNKSSPILINNLQIVPVPAQTVVQKELQSISKQAEADLYAKLLNLKEADKVRVLTTPSSKVIVTTEDVLKYYMEQPKQKGLNQIQIEELVKTAFPTEKDVDPQNVRYLMEVGKKPTQPTEIYDLRKEPHNQLTYAQLEQLGVDIIKQNPTANAFVVDSNGWTPLKTPQTKNSKSNNNNNNNNNNNILPLYDTLKQLGNNNVKLSDLDLLQAWINENILKETPHRVKAKKTERVTKMVPNKNLTNNITANFPHLIPIDLSKIKIAAVPNRDNKKDGDMDEHYRKFLNQPYWNNDDVLLRNFLKEQHGDHSIGQRFGPEFAGFYNGEAWNDAIRPVKTVKDYMSKAKPKKNRDRKAKVEENVAPSKIEAARQKPEEISRRANFDHLNLESLIRAYPMYTKLTGNTRQQGYFVEELPEDVRPSKVIVRNTPMRGYMVEEVLDHR